MFRVLFGVFIILHGLVHLWYFVLSQKLVAFQPAMGWNGRSWAFTGLLGDSPTRLLASVSFALSAIGFVAGGIAFFARAGWWSPALVASAALSAATILLFWDGGIPRVVEKGLLGFLINAALLAALLLLRWAGPA